MADPQMRRILFNSNVLLPSSHLRFQSDKRGGVAILFALSLLPLAAGMALAVDYGRAVAVKAQLQGAADSAAIAALTYGDTNPAQLKSRAQSMFDANNDGFQDVAISEVKRIPTADGIRVEVYAALPAGFAAILGIDNIDLKVTSEARSSTSDLELALVLDNTGSMSASMSDLRSAATDLVNTVFDSASGSSQLKVAVVPYVGTVNVGNDSTALSWMDTSGMALIHGISMEQRYFGYEPGCTYTPGDPADDPGSGVTGSIWKMFPKFAHGLMQVFGVASAHAATAGDVPSPYIFADPCWISSPSFVNHFDLFNEIPNASWKGCVLARQEPYDVTDEAPSTGNPDTLFVPWFWPDETDNAALAADGYTWTTDNDYLPDRADLRDAIPDVDGNVPGKFTDDWVGWGRNIPMKYNGTAGTIDETGPDTLGPNKACPDPILPLTSTKATITDKIAALTHWNSSGTNSAVGLAWGWRVLSPTEPFTEGSDYGDTRKAIVLMTDGSNNIDPKPEVSNLSHYSAYGYLQEWSKSRVDPQTYDAFTSYADSRLAQVCANAKAEGIAIYTVAFGVTDSATLAQLSACASEPAYAYTADTATALNSAFQNIAVSLSKLRLTE
jgi:Flp pilus assembly protein TadG